MLDSIYQMTLKLLRNQIFGVKMLSICHYVCNIVFEAIMLCY